MPNSYLFPVLCVGGSFGYLAGFAVRAGTFLTCPLCGRNIIVMNVPSIAVKVTAKKSFSFTVAGRKKAAGKIGLEYCGNNKASYFTCTGSCKDWANDTHRWRGGSSGSCFGSADVAAIARAIGVPVSDVSALFEAKELDIWPSATVAESVPATNMAFWALSAMWWADQFGRVVSEEDKNRGAFLVARYDAFAAARGLTSLTSLFEEAKEAAKNKLDAVRDVYTNAAATARQNVAALYAAASAAIAKGRPDANTLLSEAKAKSDDLSFMSGRAIASEWRIIYNEAQSKILASDLAAALHVFAHLVAQKWV